MPSTALSDVKAERLRDGRVRLSVGNWADVFDETRRAAWAAWYAKMGETYARGRYKEIAAALRAVN
jgi:hypothetical protein